MHLMFRYRQNEITIVMSLISMVVPNFFDLVSLLENYHPRKAMRWMLARIMALNLLRSVIKQENISLNFGCSLGYKRTSGD